MGAAKDFSMMKVVTPCGSATEDLNGSETIAFGSVIVDPSSIIKSKWPEMGIIFIWPVDLHMHKHSMSRVSDSADGTFSMGILVMGTSGRKSLVLILVQENILPLGAGEDTIVSMVVPDVNTTLCSIMFEETFGCESRVSIQGQLMVDLDES